MAKRSQKERDLKATKQMDGVITTVSFAILLMGRFQANCTQIICQKPLFIHLRAESTLARTSRLSIATRTQISQNSTRPVSPTTERNCTARLQKTLTKAPYVAELHPMENVFMVLEARNTKQKIFNMS